MMEERERERRKEKGRFHVVVPINQTFRETEQGNGHESGIASIKIYRIGNWLFHPVFFFFLALGLALGRTATLPLRESSGTTTRQFARRGKLNKNIRQVRCTNIERERAVISQRVCVYVQSASRNQRTNERVAVRARHAENVANDVRLPTRYVAKQHLPPGLFENRCASWTLAQW